MVNLRVVYYQKPVVALIINAHLHRRILAVMFFDIQLQLRGYLLGVNRCADSGAPFA